MLDSKPQHTTSAMKGLTFYQRLGRRIAERRKALGLTQTDLAQQLGVAQQTMAHYEGGTARIAVAMLPTVSRVLGVAIEELLSEEKRSSGKRGRAAKLQQQIELLNRLPRAKQRFVIEMIDAALKSADIAA
jgi:transcriptional regulator with XRE-family HTH domain